MARFICVFIVSGFVPLAWGAPLPQQAPAIQSPKIGSLLELLQKEEIRLALNETTQKGREFLRLAYSSPLSSESKIKP